MLQNDINFLEIRNIDELCNILNISKKQLNYILFVKKNKYSEFEISKKSGGVRKIMAPTSDLKRIQRRLADLLANSYSFLDVQHGFIKHRSCVTNASLHVGKRFVLNIDLENFFDTIHFGRVQGLFMNHPFNFNRQLATFIAKIVCENGKLPQGAPTSPVISNIICYKMDKDLEHLARKNRCCYSRYADDITISTNSDKFPSQIAYKWLDEIVLSNQLIKIINGGYDTGFKINVSKTKLSKCMFHQEVTGITVNARLNLSKKYIKKIRVMLNSIKNNGFMETVKKNYMNHRCTSEEAKYKMFNIIQGKLNYLKMVRGYNDKIFLKYANEFNQLFNIDFFDVDGIIGLEEYVSNRCLVLQSENEDSQGTAFIVKGNKLYTSTHVLINKTTFPNFIHDENDSKFLSQFPINPSTEKLPFFYLRNKEMKRFFNYMILENDYKTDVLYLESVNIIPKTFNLAKRAPKINDKVYLIGYPGFVDFERTGIVIIESKILGEATFFGRKFLLTKDSPKHGMSGGPVLNENREVVGIIYAGADLENDYNSDKVGFISII